jgi:adenosylcobinamide-GDP ribazoletransferase
VLQGLLSAFGFLTIIGRRGSVPNKRTSWFFPVVGLVVGALVGLVRWGAGNLWSPLIAGVLAVAADLLLTGMLHLDGLADSADGLLPHMTRERRLEVMRQPDVGAFGIGVCIIVLLLRVATITALDVEGWKLVGLCAAIWCMSRSLIAGMMALAPNARTGSLADAFGRSPFGGWGIAPAIALASAALASPRAFLTILIAVWASSLIPVMATRRLGGVTGDTLGAQILSAETIALLVATAH